MTESTFSELKLDFLVKQVFGNNGKSEEAYVDSAINRAYRDFNRTIHGYAKAKSEELHKLLILNIKGMIKDFRMQEYSQPGFDAKHDHYCTILMKVFNENCDTAKFEFSYGQAQKWINMTLKYLLTLTIVCPDLKNIETNCNWFHVPIDGYVLKKLTNVTLPQAWSRMGKEDYFKCQDAFKRQYPHQIPIEAEFKLWNEYIVNPENKEPL